MSLKNKDGSNYDLRRPKPPAITQELWEQEQANYVLHNWEWDATQSVAEPPLETVTSPPSLEHSATSTMEDLPPAPVMEDLPPAPVMEDLPPAPVMEDLLLPIPVIETPPSHKLQIPDAIRNKIVMFFCLPVIGSQFTFEGLVVGNSDLDMTVWTSLQRFAKGCIIFPSKYVNVEEEYDDYRWWKVQSCTSKSLGVLMYCTPSDTTPDFT